DDVQYDRIRERSRSNLFYATVAKIKNICRFRNLLDVLDDRCSLTDENILKGIEDDIARPKHRIVEPAEQWNNGISSKSVERWALSAFPRGLCIIINIKDFKYDPTPDKSWCRRGSEKDLESLKELFSELYFRVRVHENPTKE
ncbi:unnamed protein product, partial [Cyprideis torosa]